MQKNYLDNNALNAAREMIHAYFIDRSVEGVFKYLNPASFTFMGFTENVYFNSLEEFRKYVRGALSYTIAYTIIDEDYSVCCESQDSCLVIAKIKFTDAHIRKLFNMNYFFYFNQLDDKIVCSHYHVARPFKAEILTKPIFFNENMIHLKNANEIISHTEGILEFINSEAVAEKSFYYEDKFPYRTVNRNYMKLLGYKVIRNFVTEQNYSSLINIHPEDRSRYVEYLKNQYEKKIAICTSELKYQYRNSYQLIYRLQSPHLSGEVKVLEWGNFFTQNGSTIVNCFILNLNEAEKISLNTNSNDIPATNPMQADPISIREDCGVHIKQNVIIYPRKRQIKIDDKTIDFTPIECEIFLVLLDKLNQPISADELYSCIWSNGEIYSSSNVLPMHISNIRRKLRAHENSIKVVFIKKEGYCLRV